MRNMHPEYQKALLGKRIASPAKLKHEAHEAQELIKSYRTYKLSNVFSTLESQLAW